MKSQTALTTSQFKDLAAAIIQRVRLVLTPEGWPPVPNQIRTFAPGVLDKVKALGGQFSDARMTKVTGGETLASQRDRDVIKFRTDWHFQSAEKKRLSVSPSLGTEVIYLPDLAQGSLGCTYEQVEGQKYVWEIVSNLPQVEGVVWIVGNTPTINRILASHLQETGDYLLPDVYTWTVDTYKYQGEALDRLFVGSLLSDGVFVVRRHPALSHGDVGLFVLGVPA